MLVKAAWLQINLMGIYQQIQAKQSSEQTVSDSCNGLQTQVQSCDGKERPYGGVAQQTLLAPFIQVQAPKNRLATENLVQCNMQHALT